MAVSNFPRANHIISPAEPVSIPVDGNSVSYPLQGLTAEHIVLYWGFSNNAENDPPCGITITTNDGSFTIQKNYGTAYGTIKPVFVVPNSIAMPSQSGGT